MSDVTFLLAAVRSGEPGAEDRLWELVYSELRLIAGGRMAREHRQVTLQATALVHEAWIRLSSPEGGAVWESRAHFFSAASEAMRRVLIEQARRRLAGKRGGGQSREALSDLQIEAPSPDEKLLEVHEVLDELERIDPRQARIVKLRFFAGLGHEEIAALLGIGESSVRREWTLAKAWLFRAIKGGDPDGAALDEKTPEKP